MSYIVYYNELTKKNIKNVYWHDDEAYEEYKMQDVFTAYRVDTGLHFDTEAEADAKADELNAEQEKLPFEKEGDVRKCHYQMFDVPVPQWKVD